MDLLVHGSKDPRYSFYSIDRDPPHQMPYAVFIVPQGRYVFAKKIIGRVFFFYKIKKFLYILLTGKQNGCLALVKEDPNWQIQHKLVDF